MWSLRKISLIHDFNIQMKRFSLKHTWTIAKYHMRFSLRSGGGIVFLFMSVLSAIVVAAIFITPVEAIVGVEGANNLGGTVDIIKEISGSSVAQNAVNWLLDSKDQGKYLLSEKPALLSCIMLVLLMLLPYLVCFGAFNQTTSDIANKGLRFLLLRTERVNIYLGRFLGTVIFSFTTVVLSMMMLVLYIQFKLGIYTGVDLWLWSIQGGLSYFMLSLPFVALCAWVSSVFESPFGSLLVCMMMVGLPVIFLKILNRYVEIDSLDKFWPTGWKFGILHSELSNVIMSIGALLIFTVVFLLLGLRGFQKRDL